MRSGDLVEYYCRYSTRNKIGIFLRYSKKPHENAGILIGSEGKLIETYNFLEIKQHAL